MTETDNYHGGTFTRWIAALSAAPCNIRVNPIITEIFISGRASCGSAFFICCDSALRPDLVYKHALRAGKKLLGSEF
jgi:hypothetical protein